MSGVSVRIGGPNEDLFVERGDGTLVTVDAYHQVGHITYIRVKFDDGPWELLKLSEYLKRLGT